MITTFQSPSFEEMNDSATDWKRKFLDLYEYHRATRESYYKATEIVVDGKPMFKVHLKYQWRIAGGQRHESPDITFFVTDREAAHKKLQEHFYALTDELIGIKKQEVEAA